MSSPAETAALALVAELAPLCDIGPVAVSPGPAAADWANSGAMALTGRADGPPLLAPGAPASAVRGWLAVLAHCAQRSLQLPGPELLGERAAYAGLHRQAPRSAGGAFQCLPAADGWVGFSLSRPDDLDLLPALVEGDVADPWGALERWLARTPAVDAVDRAILLGLPAARVAAPAPVRPPVRCVLGGSRMPRDSPLIVDLSSLWAGPLCANLLGLAGAEVVKVESVTRPDGARRGNRRFFEMLHAGHDSRVLDFTSADGRGRLRELIDRADVVVDSSRPRALRQLGIDAESAVAGGAVWVGISAYGRDPADELRVGFGDDVAAGAGLVAWDGDTPVPAGDAIADPLTGVYAAAAATAALRSSRGVLLDISMHAVAVAAASLPAGEASVRSNGDDWVVDLGSETETVREPRPRC